MGTLTYFFISLLAPTSMQNLLDLLLPVNNWLETDLASFAPNVQNELMKQIGVPNNLLPDLLNDDFFAVGKPDWQNPKWIFEHLGVKLPAMAEYPIASDLSTALIEKALNAFGTYLYGNVSSYREDCISSKARGF